MAPGPVAPGPVAPGPVQANGQVRAGLGSGTPAGSTAAVAAPLTIPVTTRRTLPATGLNLGVGRYGLAALLLGGLLVTAGRVRTVGQLGGRRAR